MPVPSTLKTGVGEVKSWRKEPRWRLARGTLNHDQPPSLLNLLLPLHPTPA